MTITKLATDGHDRVIGLPVAIPRVRCLPDRARLWSDLPVGGGRADLRFLYLCRVPGTLSEDGLCAGRAALFLFEVRGEFGEEAAQSGAVWLGEAVEEGGFGGEQVGVGLVEDGAAGRGELDQH